MSLAQEVAIIWAASNGYLDSLPIGEIEKFESKLMDALSLKGKKWLNSVNKNKIVSESEIKDLEKIVKETL